MIFLGFSPYIIFTSFLITLLLDRGVFANGNKQQISPPSPRQPTGSSPESAKALNDDESEALKKVLPLVTFDCRGKTGYFTDSKFNCEVFHYCQPGGARNTFHCPSHQLFNQLSLVCEAKTIHNSRLCKEGSINSKMQIFSSSKIHDASQKASPKPSINSNSFTESSKKMMTLEDLLGYMNSGQGKEKEPTFISRFHNADESKISRKPLNSANSTPNSESKPVTEKVSTVTPDLQIAAQGSDQSFTVTKTSFKPGSSSKRTVGAEDDVSAEYDAIEGRRLKKQKRKSRVLENREAYQSQKSHSQKSIRSTTDQPPVVDSTLEPQAAEHIEHKEVTAPSLFTPDRTKARDIRKRRRYQGRKRKPTMQTAGNDTEVGGISVTYSTTIHSQAPRQDPETPRNSTYRRRKSQRPRTREGYQSSVKPHKVEPYTLPPLPTPTEDRVEVTTESMHRTEKKREPQKEGRSRNPWHKPKTVHPGNGENYGKKLSDSDQHNYQSGAEFVEGLAEPMDYYGKKDMPNTSEELISQDYKERTIIHSKTSNSGDTRPSHKSKAKNLKKLPQEDRYKYGSHHHIAPEDLFPPPRPEIREHQTTTPQQAIYESSPEKSNAEQNHYKASTEDPFRVTHPYLDKYTPGVQELRDLEEHRWKVDSEKKKSNDKKVAVGSTFFFQGHATPETTQKPTLQSPPVIQAPVKVEHKEKDASKHTLAHQHLSKIMNDFFAMSSSNTPGNSDRDKEPIIPDYRIPDEDIYATSASSTEDDEDIPPELLEVVDLLSGHVNERSELKPEGSHEVIKINGPITDSHLEKIFLEDKSYEDSDHEISADGTFKKIVVVPQSDDKEEDIKEIAEMAEFTSLKLEPLLKQLSEEKEFDDKLETILKQISDEKSFSLKLDRILKEISEDRSVRPLKTDQTAKPQPTVLTAKKVPVRVIYRDQLTKSASSKPITPKTNLKIMQHLQAPHLQPIPNGGRPIFRPALHSFGHTRSSLILHPPSIYPPHPPPLHRKQLPFRLGFPFVTNQRPSIQNMKHVPRRKKRSILSRLRRQIRQNKQFLPFPGAGFPHFNPKFVPTFSPFKSLLRPSLHAAGSHITPFAFPGFLRKPSQHRPHFFQPSHQRPPPVRHISPTGHQTVIVEEVPVPIHVEVPSPNLMRPASSGSHPSKLPPRYTENQHRNPSPPALQNPPLIQRPQNRYPPPPNNYRHFGMPSSARPPPINYQSPVSFSSPLPASITNQGQLYALGVTNKPLLPPPKSHLVRPPTGQLNNSPRNPPRPYNPYQLQAPGYPNFPYFHSFTTPISHEPVVGRLMYSGYKPPKSTLGTKSPKVNTPSNKDWKTSESKSNRPKSKPGVDYFEVPTRPMRESHVSYTEEVISRARPKTKPNLQNYSSLIDRKPSVQSLTKSTISPYETTTRKRKPSRRRRPKPHSTTTQGTTLGSALNEISPTPPPPEQIPPPPADYTSKPVHHDAINSLPSISEGTKTFETSSHFPPAGYYGKDQLVQFFDSSSKSHHKANSPKPVKELGESRSAELDESLVSMSGEKGNEPAFGTRLKAKSRNQSRSRQSKNKQPVRSQTQNTEVRTRPNNKPDDAMEKKRKEIKRPNPNEGERMPIRTEKPPPRRRRPPPTRPRPRPSTVPAPTPEIHHFKLNENIGNFYSVPRGLHNLVAPSSRPQHSFHGTRDMFGIPHPVIDPNIYSLRPQGAPVDFDQNFFSVPAHVAQQQQSPLHKINIKPIPESARDFFSAPDPGVSAVPEASTPQKQESEHRSTPTNSAVDNKDQQDKPARKLRKPKRKNRYNPHSNEQKDSVEVSSAKPHTEQTTTRDSNSVRFKEKMTTLATTTTEPRSTSTVSFPSHNDIKESTIAFKQRTPFLPKTLPEISKSLLNGKIDIQKLNATISTSVSVSGAIPQTNNTSSEDKENKKVFSSQNGGLAVVRKGPKRKRARQRTSTTTGVPYVNNNQASTDAKYEIAASVLDIIKATTETERQASGYYNNEKTPQRVTNPWIESPSIKRH